MEQRRIRELEHLPPSAKYSKLNTWQVGKLRRCILTLPFRDGQSLCNHYLHGKEMRQGAIEYLRESLTRKMKLQYPISDESLRQALELL